MSCVFGDPKTSPPPLQKLSPDAMVSVIWQVDGSLVEELLDSMALYVDEDTLNNLKSKIDARNPSRSGDLRRELRKTLLCYKCRHDVAADLIHMYAFTKNFFRVKDYKAVKFCIQTTFRRWCFPDHYSLSTRLPIQICQTHMLQETSGVPPVGARKRKAHVNAKSKKKYTSNRQSNSRRQSLADAGFTWKSGVRRSTRIKTRPLQHWCGEKVLYGRVHNSMITVIGMRYAEKEVDGKSPVLKVKSYVSDKYVDLVSKVAK